MLNGSDIGGNTISVIVVVVAFYVLPSFAPVAKHRVSIVELETTEALNGVILLFFDRRGGRVHGVTRVAVQCWVDMWRCRRVGVVR